MVVTNQYKNKSITANFIWNLLSTAPAEIFCEKSIYFARKIKHTFSFKNIDFPIKTILFIIPNLLTNQYKTFGIIKIVYRVLYNLALGHEVV